MVKPLVYVASPYTRGDSCVNTNFQMRVFNDMMNDGIVIPIVPLWSHFQHTAFPRPYKDWIEYDLALIPRLDACLRLNAEDHRMPALAGSDSSTYKVTQSSGADGEVQHFRDHGKPVFYDAQSLYAWARALNADLPHAKMHLFDQLVRGAKLMAALEFAKVV